MSESIEKASLRNETGAIRHLEAAAKLRVNPGIELPRRLLEVECRPRG